MILNLHCPFFHLTVYCCYTRHEQVDEDTDTDEDKDEDKDDDESITAQQREPLEQLHGALDLMGFSTSKGCGER